MRTWLALLAVCVACGTPLAPPVRPQADGTRPGGSVRLVFGGDVMLGRGVAPLLAADPAAPLQGVRTAIAGADFAIANLESPLTSAPHRRGPHALEAAPSAAESLRAAGFDAMSIANNHAADAGPTTGGDTAAALRDAGIGAVGAGTGSDPVVQDVRGVRVAWLAFDASGGAGRGVATWSTRVARPAVDDARRRADLVAVSLHGGLPYSSTADAFLGRIARRLAGWGVDVVWGHGPHVVQPVRAIDPDGDGRVTVVATSLGNLLFDDQGIPGTDLGLLLEVRANADGVVAYRLGDTRLRHGRASLVRWRPPRGDAVGFDGGWWTPIVPIRPAAGLAGTTHAPALDPGWDVRASTVGDLDGDGTYELIVSFRAHFRRWPVYPALDEPRSTLLDPQGRTWHLAVFGADLRPRWIASATFRPIRSAAACGGALAVTYRTLDDPTVTGIGLWPWHTFGFTTPSNLPGSGTLSCVDLDGDGAPEPAITGR